MDERTSNVIARGIRLGFSVKKALKTLKTTVATVQQDIRHVAGSGNGVFRFDTVEQDIQRFMQQCTANGAVALGAYLIITTTDKGYNIKIEVYTEKDAEVLQSAYERPVIQLERVPDDIQSELHKNGTISLYWGFAEE